MKTSYQLFRYASCLTLVSTILIIIWALFKGTDIILTYLITTASLLSVFWIGVMVYVVNKE